MTHAELCAVAVKWLKRPNSANGHGCQVAVSECAPDWAGERPDAIGFRAGFLAGSVLVECKVSRSDFHADKAKPHRQPGSGMGTWRYYMAPKGLLSVSDMPERWGLLEVNSRGHVSVMQGAAAVAKNYGQFREAVEAFRHVSDIGQELSLLVRLLARLGDAEAMNRTIRDAMNGQARLTQQLERLQRRNSELTDRIRELSLRLQHSVPA